MRALPRCKVSVKFRDVLETEYLGHRLPDGPPPAPSTAPSDHVGVHTQKDGLLYVGATPTVGRVSGAILDGLADAVERAGSARLRLTPHQKVDARLNAANDPAGASW